MKDGERNLFWMRVVFDVAFMQFDRYVSRFFLNLLQRFV